MFCSPERPKALGIPYAAWLGALVDAIDRARRDFGIEARIIGICIRHLGPDRALALAQQMVAEPHPYVVALGMGGDEAKFTPADFAPAYRLAHENGLGCTVHAGEVVGPESVWAADPRPAGDPHRPWRALDRGPGAASRSWRGAGSRWKSARAATWRSACIPIAPRIRCRA